MNILIGADLVPTASNQDLFLSGNATELVGPELKKILDEAEYRIFNLEVPLTDKADPIPKCGPNLIAPTQTVKGYMALGVNLLTLANNHILDQGQEGFISTCRVLDDNGIAYLGAGNTPEEAAKPYLFMIGDKKIGIYACAEHEFSIVSETHAGANPFDPMESPDHVAALKQQCDFLIVLYHGGKEHYRYPSPGLQKVCRKLIEKGADLVICQHSHCIGCEEKYRGGTIVYGQGNFLFDNSNSEYWQTSLLVQIDETFQISYLPLTKQGNSVCLADKERADEILEQFRRRSQEIQSDGFVAKNYEAFAVAMRNTYLLGMSGIHQNLVFRAINKLSKYRLMNWTIKHKYKKQNLLVIRNYIECEAHSELFLAGIKKQEETNGEQ